MAKKSAKTRTRKPTPSELGEATRKTRRLNLEIDREASERLASMCEARRWTYRRAIEESLALYARVVGGDLALVRRLGDGSPSQEEWPL